MILEQYNIKLTRLLESEIELVRYWRNQPHIRNQMEYRDYITPEMQKKWFSTVNNKYHYYFIINYENNKVGLINVKGYKDGANSAEGGIFIWDKKYLDSYVPAFASLCLINFIFKTLQGFEYSYIRILKTNTTSINYNLMLGYEIEPNQENDLNQLYKLSKDVYLKRGSKINKAAAFHTKDNAEVRLYGEPSEINLEQINNLLIKKNINESLV